MRPYILAENNWKSLQTDRYDVAILPWGATEAHNYHLPYGTDVIEADFIAAESARIAWELGAKVVVLPTIPFGVNTGQSYIYLDMNLNPTTQLAILRDVIDTLSRHEIHKLYILNGHGGNDFKWMLRELGLQFPEMFLCTTNWFQSMDMSKYFEESGNHADEMETSLILHLKPELVLPLSECGDGSERKSKIAAMRDGWVWAERKWSQISKDTGVGDPRKATAEKGERLFRDLTQKIGHFLVELSKTDTTNLYQDPSSPPARG